MFLFDWFYGILISLGLWQKEAKILFLGLNNAEKTVLLQRLRVEEFFLNVILNLYFILFLLALVLWFPEDSLFSIIFNYLTTFLILITCERIVQHLQRILVQQRHQPTTHFFFCVISLNISLSIFLDFFSVSFLDSFWGSFFIYFFLRIVKIFMRLVLQWNQPTQYSTSVELSILKINFKVFDLGGHQTALRVLRDYNAKVDAVVYVVNACDLGRLPESKRELDALRSDESLANVPFLILASAPSPIFDELSLHDDLGLTNLTTGRGIVNLDANVRPLEFFICSNSRDQLDGFVWLSRYIN